MDRENIDRLEHACSIIMEHGRDSLHYLSLNQDNSFFFGDKVRGVTAYTLVGKRAMSMGDPVCRSDDMEAFVDEYLDFCRKSRIKPIFNSVSEHAAGILKRRGLIVLKYGEEAILKLDEYTFPKSSTALRRNYNKVEKTGAILKEYYPGVERDYDLEEKIRQLAEAYYASKGYKMGYSVGGLDFDRLYDRRFFITVNESGELLTFLTFLPYNRSGSYCVDIMCRKTDTMTGVMEHALLSAAMKMKGEGVDEVSLGVAPLSGIDVSDPKTSKTEKLLNSIFNSMEYGYNFKNLYRFKKKFAPTFWKPRFLVYHPGISLKKLALAFSGTRQESIPFNECMKNVFAVIADFCGVRKNEKKEEKVWK